MLNTSSKQRGKGTPSPLVTDQIDWTGCPITERNPKKMVGVSTVRALRLSADSVIECYDGGATPEEIADWFDVPEDDVRTIIGYADCARYSSSS